jgi:hypothetical protein
MNSSQSRILRFWKTRKVKALVAFHWSHRGEDVLGVYSLCCLESLYIYIYIYIYIYTQKSILYMIITYITYIYVMWVCWGPVKTVCFQVIPRTFWLRKKRRSWNLNCIALESVLHSLFRKSLLSLVSYLSVRRLFPAAMSSFSILSVISFIFVWCAQFRQQRIGKHNIIWELESLNSWLM